MLEDPELLDRLTRTISVAAPSGYELQREAAERHGSWEWLLARSGSGDLVWAVVIAFTDLGGPEFSARVDIDLWAAADSEDRFVRVPVRHAEFQARDGEELIATATGMLPPAIRAAAGVAERFSPDDLNEAYARSSPITPPEPPAL